MLEPSRSSTPVRAQQMARSNEQQLCCAARDAQVLGEATRVVQVKAAQRSLRLLAAALVLCGVTLLHGDAARVSLLAVAAAVGVLATLLPLLEGKLRLGIFHAHLKRADPACAGCPLRTGKSHS
jgi:hypothetical protein